MNAQESAAAAEPEDVFSRRACAWPRRTKQGPVRMIEPAELKSWIVHEDERLLVVAKPGDVVCHPSKAGPWSSLVGAAREYTELPTMHLVFRLDRETMTTEFAPGFRLMLEPFLGIMGVAPPDDGSHSSVAPGPFGGNLDLCDLIVGTTLVLPVFRRGAGFYAGDAHALQGDGEVNQTAIETSMKRAHLRLTAGWPSMPGLPRLPWVETPTHLITIGLDEDLDLAVRQAVDALVTHMSARFDIDEIDAYALASLTADVEVTQAVNRVKGAHARLPWEMLGLSEPPAA